MARCDACFSVLTKKDVECYVCGEPVKDAPKRPWGGLLGSWSKPSKAPQKTVTVTDAILNRSASASKAR